MFDPYNLIFFRFGEAWKLKVKTMKEWVALACQLSILILCRSLHLLWELGTSFHPVTAVGEKLSIWHITSKLLWFCGLYQLSEKMWNDSLDKYEIHSSVSLYDRIKLKRREDVDKSCRRTSAINKNTRNRLDKHVHNVINEEAEGRDIQSDCKVGKSNLSSYVDDVTDKMETNIHVPHIEKWVYMKTN